MTNYLDNEAAIKLAKANLALAVRLSALAHRQNMSLMEFMMKDLSGSFSEFENSAKTALKCGDWVSMSNACVSIPFLLAKIQTQQIQHSMDSGAKAQQQINAALKDALTAWQKETSTVMQTASGVISTNSTLRSWLDGSTLPPSAEPAEKRPDYQPSPTAGPSAV